MTEAPRKPLRPDLDRAIAHLASGAPAHDDPDPIGAMRAFTRRYGDVSPRQPLQGVTVTTVANVGFAAEWIVAPGAETARRLVHLHGGGWIAGDLESHRPLAAELARLSGAAVLLVDYRLAPEHPYPAGLNDCTAALEWTFKNGPDGASPASSVVLAGDSAGANLAAAACYRSAARPHRLVLICGALDGTVALGASAGRAVGPDAAGLAAMMQLYAQGRTPLADPGISPLLASDEEIAALPPTLIQVSGAEYLFSHSERFASRLIANGVRTVLSSWPDMPHVWHAFLDLLPEARAALREVAAFVRCDS